MYEGRAGEEGTVKTIVVFCFFPYQLLVCVVREGFVVDTVGSFGMNEVHEWSLSNA